MGMNITFYKVVENIAQRSGLILERYRTKDMNWILDNNDLRRVRFTPDEYIDGLQGVVKITGTEADALIAENNYQMGYEGLEPNNNQQEQPQEEQEVEQEAQTETVDEQTEQNDETPEKTLKLDFGREGKYEVYLVDNDHHGELWQTTSDLTLTLKVHSVVLIREL